MTNPNVISAVLVLVSLCDADINETGEKVNGFFGNFSSSAEQPKRTDTVSYSLPNAAYTSYKIAHAKPTRKTPCADGAAQGVTEIIRNYLRAMARRAAAVMSSAVRLYCCMRKSCGPT